MIHRVRWVVNGSQIIVVLLVVAIWHRSYDFDDRVYLQKDRFEVDVHSGWGFFRCTWMLNRARSLKPKVQIWIWPATPGPDDSLNMIESSSLKHGYFFYIDFRHGAKVHYGLVLALIGLANCVLRFPSWRARRIATWRRLNCICPVCGYDLRGAGERCSECGTMVPAKLQSKEKGAVQLRRGKRTGKTGHH